MEQLRIVYRLLRTLQRTMGDEEFDPERIGAQALCVPDAMWRQLMAMLAKRGYVEGVRVVEYDSGDLPLIRWAGRPVITLEGLEYLEENSVMKKLARGAQGFVSVIGTLK